MIEINNKKLCGSCFYETDEEICPNCGFSAEEYSADPLVLPMGTRLGDKIVIGRVMGKGGFGVTYLGYDLRMNKIIAVKEYYPNGIAYRSHAGTEVSLADTKSSETFDKGAEKFYDEAEMVAQFNGNPNIVSVYDYFRENNTVYLVMEYISGITLKNYVKKHGRLTDGQALFIMDKIAAALSITHSAGVLHRDISPDNIMICMDGKVKLIDFGAARQIMAESSSNLTVVMKPGYTPVEQYTKKGRQGAWTDIYSLGVSVYYALTEVIIDDPYARMDDDSELEENKHGINSDLWAILKKCTMINAPDRYGSAIDLRKALRSVSAPIKSEPIKLTDDDLKTDIDSNAPIVPDGVTDKKEISLTTAAPVSETTEVIEVFEDSPPPPPADENIHAAKAAVKDSTDKDKDKAKSKNPVFIGICAAAVLIVGIIGTAIAVNNSGDSEMVIADTNETSAAAVTENSTSTKKDSTTAKPPANDTTATTVPEREEENTVPTAKSASETTSAAVTTTTTAATTTAAKPQTTTTVPTTTTKVTTTTTTEPEKIEKPLYIPLSTKYPGQWAADEDNIISKSSLKHFTGDIKVVLDTECVNANKNDEGGYWRSITIIDGNWNTLNVCAVNTGTGPWGSYTIYDGQTKFAFTVKRADIDKVNTKLMFQVENVIVKGATIYDFDPKDNEINPKAKIIQLDSKYPGTWNWSKSIPKEELESFKGDVKVTLSIEAVKDDGESAEVNDRDVTIYWVNMDCITFNSSDFDNKKVVVKADNFVIDENMVYNLGTANVPDKFTFVVSSSEISKLYDGGLAFGCRNVIVKSAALEKA